MTSFEQYLGFAFYIFKQISLLAPDRTSVICVIYVISYLLVGTFCTKQTIPLSGFARRIVCCRPNFEGELSLITLTLRYEILGSDLDVAEETA
jgi:hypothetical protein